MPNLPTDLSDLSPEQIQEQLQAELRQNALELVRAYCQDSCDFYVSIHIHPRGVLRGTQLIALAPSAGVQLRDPRLLVASPHPRRIT